MLLSGGDHAPAGVRRGPAAATWSLAAGRDDSKSQRTSANHDRIQRPRYARRVRIVLDPDRCTGHGRCYSLAPHVFDADDEGHSVVLLEEVPPEYQGEARQAVDACPESAISIEG